jgi:hypothetical protein
MPYLKQLGPTLRIPPGVAAWDRRLMPPIVSRYGIPPGVAAWDRRLMPPIVSRYAA